MSQESDLLAEEQAFYDKNEAALLADHPNRHLLIHGSRLVGHFESVDEAVSSARDHSWCAERETSKPNSAYPHCLWESYKCRSSPVGSKVTTQMATN